MSQELEHFFGTSEIDDIDTMFYNFIFQESSEPAPIRLIKKYNASLSPSLKDKLITFIFCTLEEQLDNSCCDPTILIEPSTQNNDLYYKIVDVLELISKKPESKGLFTYLIYYTSYLISKQRIKRDDLKYYNIFKFLCSLKGNKRIFEDKKVWGLVYLPDSIYVRNDAIESFYANQNFERIIIDLKSKAISQIQSDNELYNDAMDYNSIFKYKLKFLPFEAYKQKGIIPCFLEGALVPFFYNRERYCDMLFDKSTADIRNSLDLFIGDIKYIQSNLHSTLFSIKKDNEKARNYFVQYIRVLYRNNRDRRKMMFNEKICITDGVAFNFCNLLDAFCDKIVVKKMFDRIDYNYLDRILDVKDDKKDNEIEDKDVPKIDENHNVFCTTILTYRILFTELSYIKMFDEKRLILDQMDDFEDERIRKALDSRLNVYRTILFSDFFFQQDSFLEYMVECIIYKDGLDIKNTSLSFNPLFYKILIDFKHHNMVCYYGKISNDVYLIMQRMLLSDINIHEKEKIIRIMYEEKWDITEELFLKLCDIYAQAGKLSLLDRFTIRGYINLIIQNDRNKYIKTLKKNGISFVSGAIQDLEKLLSTGIDAIVNIKKLSITKKEIESKNHKPEENEEYKKIVEKLKDLERQAQGSFGHVDKAFEIVHYILSNNLTLFTYNEVKFLLVNTLNYYLKVLVGPKCSSLSVGNMKKYNFKPREILGLLCTIYSDIRTPNLQEAIVNGKDFNLHFFNRALGIVKERSILNANDLVKFEKFVNQIEGISNQLVEKEEKVYPDEFLDPLTFEVMSNPIKLLTSNVTIDKSTFDLIMVSDGVDPFCREPLDESKYVNDDELKKRIEEFEKQ